MNIEAPLLPAGFAPRSFFIVLPYLAVGLTLMATFFHHRRLKEKLGDARGMRLYFVLFFLLLFLVPLLIIVFSESEPPLALAGMGLRLGNAALGFAIVAAAAPVTLLIGYFASGTPEIQAQYPYSKTACKNDRSFVLYETLYVLLYYTAWEFLYRGVLFFPLLNNYGILIAFSVPTALSTLHHTGHPDSEVWGALAGGILFSAIAMLTGSILYPLLVHALLGVSDDAFVYLRCHRKKRDPR